MNIINQLYTIEHRPRGIHVKYKHANSKNEELKIIPFHSPQTPICVEMVRNQIREIAHSLETKQLILFITNINIDLPKSVLERANCSIIKGETEFEIKQGLDIFFRLHLKQINNEFLKSIRANDSK